MSFNLIGELMRKLPLIKKDGYSPLNQLVLLHIADITNDKQGFAWPSMSYLAKQTWISENHVRKIIRDLEKDGLLEVTQRSQKTSHYRIRLPEQPIDYAATKAENDESDTPSEDGGLHSESGPVPSSEWPTPTPLGAGSHSESGRTYNLTNHLNQTIKPVTEPAGSVPVFSSREAKQGVRPNNTADHPPVLAKSEPSQNAKSASAIFSRLFPEARTSAADFEKIMTEYAVSYDELTSVLGWINDKGEFWRQYMSGSAYLATKYPKIHEHWLKYMAKAEHGNTKGFRRHTKRNGKPSKSEIITTKTSPDDESNLSVLELAQRTSL